MTSRQINLVLRISAAAVCAVAIAAVLAGVMLPLGLDLGKGQSSSTTLPAAKPRTPNGLPPLDTFADAWVNPLRRPLKDPIVGDAPATVTQQSVAVPASMVPQSLTLVGTIGTSLAMLREADGSIAVKGVGESIGGAEIVAIRPSQVELRQSGQSLTLERAKNPDGAIVIH